MLHVATSADERFAADCAVMLTSLVATNPPEALHVHLLHDGSLSDASAGSLAEIVTRAGGRCEPLALQTDPGSPWPASERFTAAAWFRVRLPELLPSVDRVLYVDADALFASGVAELFEHDMAGSPLGAITNPLYDEMVERIRRDLGVPEGADYFNSGVLLMDLDRWRSEGTAAQILDFVLAHPLEWPDQDALNGVLHARRLHLHPRWNAMPGIWELPRRYLPYTDAEIRETRAAPAIVHFVGPYKPWHYRSRHPYRAQWFGYLAQTPWRGREVEGRSVWQAFLRRLPAVWAYRAEIGVIRVRPRLVAARDRARAKLPL